MQFIDINVWMIKIYQVNNTFLSHMMSHHD